MQNRKRQQFLLNQNLKFNVGEEIKLKETDFILLNKAYFTEIKNKLL